jgi:chromosome partitioning protein
MSEPRVLTISNRKGGSGKSTSAVNLAAEWAARGARTLVVDLDTQGHAGLGLGVTAAKGAATAHSVFQDPAFDIRAAIVATQWPNLSCVPADQLFDGRGASQDLTALRRQLRRPEMAALFDIVVLDTPPSLDFVLMNAMAAADGVLIPMLPHALSAEGVKQLSRLFFRIATTANPGLKMLGLLPVMVNSRVNHHRNVLADVTRQFGPERVLRGVRTDIVLAEAFAAGKPIRAFAPRSRGGMDYFLLADELPRLWRWALPDNQQRASA